MFVFVALAVVEVMVGLGIYEMLDPEKGKKAISLSMRVWMYLEGMIFGSMKKDTERIKKANKIAFKFCVASALLTLINGVLHVYFNFMDLKEVIVLVMAAAIFPLRYIYMLGGKEKKEGESLTHDGVETQRGERERE